MKPTVWERARVPQNHARGVVARRAGDAAAGMLAACAMVAAFQRPAIDLIPIKDSREPFKH
jgi:hypothetical protein